MRFILLLLLAAVFGYGILHIDKIDPDNYVKMYIGGHLVEVKVLGFILLLIGLVLVMYFLFWLFRTLWRSPKTFAKWRGQRNHDKAEQHFGSAYLSLIKGDWQRAENLLLKKSKHSGIPYVNFLAAAQAAQEQGRLISRDEYLKAAYKAAPKERLAIGLTKAKLHQRAGQMEQALSTLHDLNQEGKKNPQYTAMLLQAYEESQDWPAAKGILATAKKQKALPQEVITEIENKIFADALESTEDVSAAWKQLPSDQKKSLNNIAIYSKSLIEKGNSKEAEKLISSALKSNWSDELVNIYGGLTSSKPAKQLRKVEGWMLARPENAELHLAAGRFAFADKDFDAAKSHLQTAIKLGQLPQAYSVLGEVFEASNESGKALQLYRAGMQSLANGNAGLEQLVSPETEVENEIVEAESDTSTEGELVAEQQAKPA
ncbi:MAG: hypothetical protein KTR16_16875 [Acidiferrobacterales bacterium]|nr:hypothetical protein [Acidiferrobacterales bacterium]